MPGIPALMFDPGRSETTDAIGEPTPSITVSIAVVRPKPQMCTSSHCLSLYDCQPIPALFVGRKQSHLQSSSILSFAPALFWMIGIFLLSSRSNVPNAGLNSDALPIAGHLTAFGGLAVLLALPILGILDERARALAIAWFATVVYGISDEVHQSFVPGRDATMFDITVDAIGAALALATLLVILMKLQKRKS